jgi:hypothetical protein
MIYLLDGPRMNNSHSAISETILKQFTNEAITLIEVSVTTKIDALCVKLTELTNQVTTDDIVLCPWAIPKNVKLDLAFTALAEKCSVVAGAGNSSEPIENFTPSGTDGVITVGCLNKMGAMASLSNFSSTKRMEWVTGTNFNINGQMHSGTSISAAIYAAFLAEANAAKDLGKLQVLIEERKMQVKLELQNKI